MKTIRLFDADSFCRRFEARVLDCEASGEGNWRVMLDRTAFFPEGGGQGADRGTLDGVPVLDVRERGGEILHTLPRPLPIGAAVMGELDWALRFRRMQGHSGEHIVSGLVHRLYGYDNVGFHLGDAEITLDFNGALTRAQLDEIESLANGAVLQNIPVRAEYPDPAALAAMEYRSKLALTENVRIVTIEGYDRCACCAPHVQSTGQIGLVKLLDCIRYKGGVRIWMLCGQLALADYRARYAETAAISALLSVPQNEVSAGVSRLAEELEEQKRTVAALRGTLARLRAEAIPPCEGNLLLFNPVERAQLKEFANAAADRCGGVCGILLGDNGAGYQYTLISRHADLRTRVRDWNTALNGRGGGSGEMAQGSVRCTESDIRRVFAELFD